jgi:uncharacterized protein YecT (DUF1311 family)
MYKAGGIIAIIAGIFGIFAAGFTLLFGGLATAFKADGGSTVVALGWGGVGFSFLTIIFGAMALSRVRWAGIGIIICAIAGAILGGTLVAVFMALSLIGGVLTLFSKTQEHTMQVPIQGTSMATQSTSIPNASTLANGAPQTTIPNSITTPRSKKSLLIISGLLVLTLLVGILAYFIGAKQKDTQVNVASQTGSPKLELKRDIKSEKPQKAMYEAGRCLFILEGKESTAMTMEALLQNKGVTLVDKNSCAEWIKNDPIIEAVFAIQSLDGKNGKYIIKSGSTPETKFFPKEFEVHIETENEEEKSLIENTSKFQGIHVKGKLVTNSDSNFHVLNPAYIIPAEKKIEKSELPNNNENSNKSVQSNQQTIAPASSEVQATTAPKSTPISSNSTTYHVCNLDPNGDNFLALKDAPLGTSPTLLKMSDGTALSVLEKRDSWYQVKMTNGKIGWAHSKWLCEANGQTAPAERMLPNTASRPSKSPSFNCQNASSKIENMICNSNELSELDAQLSATYKEAFSFSSDKELLKKHQNNWRNNRDACSTEPCVKSAYKKRINELILQN